jgi:coniferyl-aldehyde dehydrogenase
MFLVEKDAPMDVLPASDTDSLIATLARQRAAFLRDGPPTPAERRRDLNKLKGAILVHEEDFVRALNADFGHRSREETLMFDVRSTVSTINYLRRNLSRWMRPEPRGVAMVFHPSSNRVVYQPLGVVGIVSPWNYPVGLALIPLATALAAGNRVMVKPSELVPATTKLVASMLAEIFEVDQVAVVTGDARVGSAFSSLPFDRLLFTGSIPVGRSIMRAASENLVPVTLELGGKSPAIVERGYPLHTAARRIAYGKLANGGQTCVAPDYALVPEDEIEDFVATFNAEAERLYPDVAANPDYTWIINDRHFARLTDLVDDAKAKGARVVQLGSAPSAPAAAQSRMFRPVLLLDVTDEMTVTKDEIFGPILPIIPYCKLEDAVTYVNARPRPLALYYFGPDGPGRRLVLERTISGNVTINDTILHYAQEDLPFGGVGQSGMGAYHAVEGFKTMSHAKGVFEQAGVNFTDLFRPPYSRIFDLLVKWTLR